MLNKLGHGVLCLFFGNVEEVWAVVTRRLLTVAGLSCFPSSSRPPSFSPGFSTTLRWTASSSHTLHPQPPCTRLAQASSWDIPSNHGLRLLEASFSVSFHRHFVTAVENWHSFISYLIHRERFLKILAILELPVAPENNYRLLPT